MRIALEGIETKIRDLLRESAAFQIVMGRVALTGIVGDLIDGVAVARSVA